MSEGQKKPWPKVGPRSGPYLLVVLEMTRTVVSLTASVGPFDGPPAPPGPPRVRDLHLPLPRTLHVRPRYQLQDKVGSNGSKWGLDLHYKEMELREM